MYRSQRPGGSGGGRPRDPRIDDAVLAATRALLAEVGYGRLSFELVAQRAGVTRPAIYRRWPSKVHLVHEAVFPQPGNRFVEDTGDFEADLRRQVGHMVASYARPEARAALSGLLTDLHGDTALRHSVIDRLEDEVRAQFAQRVATAVAAGQIDGRCDADLVLDVIVGAVFHRVVARDQSAVGVTDEIVDLVLAGLRPR